MVSPCYECKYASEDVHHCGKGLQTRYYSSCTSYREGGRLSEYTTDPDCGFPISNIYMDDSPRYFIHVSNPITSYLIANTSWVIDLMPRVAEGVAIYMAVDYYWGREVTHWEGGSSYTSIIPPKMGVPIPTSLWWLSPTLSYEEVVPMYALLIVLERDYRRCTLPTKTSLLGEVLAVGNYYRGNSITDWSHCLVHGPPSPYPKTILMQYLPLSVRPTLLDIRDMRPVWGPAIHQHWKQVMADMYAWLEAPLPRAYR